MRKVTMADVAKHANVSKSTVSQYLNSRFDYMGKATKKRIEQSILELGYQPNAVARSLKQKKTFTIGVIVANILHSFSTQVIRTIEDICHENNYHVIVCNADDSPKKEKKYIEMLMAKQVDGLIVFPTGGNIELYESLVKNRYPLVFMDRIVPDVPVDTVILNNEKASELAINHFVKKGYERIGIITTSLIQKITPRIERIEGYKKALNKRSIAVQDEYVRGIEIKEITASLEAMFSLPKPPQAILAGNDLSLMEVLRYARDHKKQIPQDFALIGIDEVSFASIYSPALTIIKQPTLAMGEKAATLLIEKIEKADTEKEIQVYRFEPELVVRESC
ncbi:LacI family transcriptional regulator [Bacillus canaveralius]|uniref:LacI family transcriptional regulator n=1 Tax=Bacillus canaveralius TaxID=1403243 RepID=A0A2N5GK77_9BACI|nr:substrate-binding domain-containing protein [Bacillus canaveralius]PLR81673.1 LacI family transcriptional regulator [Bacillus canaveralius]PLR89917.1 LacI family transcriptional regulator [Bacillus canaveralius]